jgi:RNA polymerase sigma-70 factor (ECF subfamily)
MRRIGPPPVLPDHSAEHLSLMAALRQLPDGQRYVLALHYLVDLSVEETAGILGISVGTVKSRLSRGRAALAGLVGEVEVPSTAGSEHA